MKFLTLGLEPRGEWERLDADEQSRRVGNHTQKMTELVAARARSGPPGLIYAAAGLRTERLGTVTVKNQRGRHLCVDGPFPETKEVVNGFEIIEFSSRQDAIEFARNEHVHHSHVSEIRPVKEFWWISQVNARTTAKLFMLTSAEDERAVLSLPESERKQIVRQHQSVGAEYVTQRPGSAQDPRLWVGVRLSPSAEATTIRWTGGDRLTSDGPFCETKEVIGGFNLVACASRDEAVEWAQKLASRDGDAIEVRAVGECWWIYHE